MKIAAALNGNMISEKSAEYALLHAHETKGSLLLFFSQNSNDSLQKVDESSNRLIALAKTMNVPCNFISSKETIDTFVTKLVPEHQIDLIYCSTRAEKSFFEYSFSERLVNSKPNCAIAVVKVASMHSIGQLEKIGLYARNQKLKTELFNLSAAFCKSLSSKLVITTNLEEKKEKLMALPFNKKRRKLNLLDKNLKPYIELANLMDLKSTIYRLFKEDIKEEQLVYVLSRNIDMLIFEAYKWPFIPLSIKNPAEELFKQIPINCIIYYPAN